MKSSLKLLNSSKITKALNKQMRRGVEWDKAMYTVGYSQTYALAVHEQNRKYTVGQWKYLETPYRRLSNSGELAKIISKATLVTKTLTLGLKLAAFRILGESQDEFVPVKTGALKASGFVGSGRGEAQAAAALTKSNVLAAKGKKK